MLVNHYGRQPASPPIVYSGREPSASEDAMVQSLRDEHELIANFMKRNQEQSERPGAFGGSATTQIASVAPFPLWLVDSAVARASGRPHRKRRLGSRQKTRGQEKGPRRRRRRLPQSDPPAGQRRSPRYWPPRRPPPQDELEPRAGADHFASPAKSASGSRM